MHESPIDPTVNHIPQIPQKVEGGLIQLETTAGRLKSDPGFLESELRAIRPDLLKHIERMLNGSNLKNDAEDIVQIAMFNAFKSIKLYVGESSFKNWVYTIADNALRDFARRSNVRSKINMPDVVSSSGKQIDMPSDELNPEESYGHQEENQRILEILETAKTKEENRKIFKMFYIDDLSIGEISEKLDIPEGTVKSKLSRTRNKINSILKIKGVRSKGTPSSNGRNGQHKI